jgi:hypothetical protein
MFMRPHSDRMDEVKRGEADEAVGVPRGLHSDNSGGVKVALS